MSPLRRAKRARVRELLRIIDRAGDGLESDDGDAQLDALARASYAFAELAELSPLVLVAVWRKVAAGLRQLDKL